MVPMSKRIRAWRNFLGFLLKLSILPYVLYVSPEYLVDHNISPLSSILGPILIGIGIAGIIISDLLILRFGDGNLHLSKTVTRLVDVGFYARTRHPFFWFFSIYQLGVFVQFTGFTWLVTLLSLGMSLLYLIYLLLIQETLLRKTLGDRYKDYRARTPFWYWKLRIPENLKVELRPQLVWLFGMLVLRFWYRIRLKGSENIPHDRPFLLVANHESYLDPFLFGIFVPFEIKFVTTADVFTTPLMRFLLKGTGSFPMRRHRQDLKSIRTMIRMVNKGQVVCIFPEGGRSIDGSPLPILRETLKLIQKCRVPILPVHLDGAYEIWPRWAPNQRHGQVTATFGPMIEVHDQSDLEQLQSKISDKIFAPDKTFSPVRGSSIAKGMDNLFWACYKCQTRNSIEVTSGMTIACNNCESIWDVAQDYTLTDRELSESRTSIDWIQDINKSVLDSPLEDVVFPGQATSERLYLESAIARYENDDGGSLETDIRLILTDKRMLLLDSEVIVHSWPLQVITIFTMDYFNAVSIGVGGVRHSFKLPPQEITLKWQTYFDTLKSEINKSLQNSEY